MDINNHNKLNYKVKIIDNFLEENDYKSLCSLNIEKNIKTGVKIYHNKIDEKKILVSCIDNDLLHKIHKKYHQIAKNILNEISPEKLRLYDYSDFSITVISKNSKFPIHDDTPDKLLSGVIYLNPSENLGTIFYNNKKGADKTHIKWKSNRAVFFSRKERETWHSYQGDEKNNRVVLVYNLMTNRIKEVFKIEKKNHFVGNLRYKLNPYLFKYFKKTI